MGDAADMAIEWDDPNWDEPLLDDLFWNDSFTRSRSVKCKVCGKKGLRWEKIDNKFVLFENNKKHLCDYKQYFNGLKGVHP